MNFLYFIEGTKSPTAEMIEAAGLTHALVTGEITVRETTKGPGPKGGVVMAVAGTPAGDIKYSPKSQTWAKVEPPADAPDDAHAAYIGYATDSPPGPMDLIRNDPVLDGYALILQGPGGEGRWFVPRARIYDEDIAGDKIDGPTSDLPQSLSMVGGEIVKTDLPRYRQACLDADRIWAAVLSANSTDADPAEEVVLGDDEEFNLAARILGINYKVAIPEINALAIITTETMGNIVRCFVDFPAWAIVERARAAAKKPEPSTEAPDTESLNSGQPAD